MLLRASMGLLRSCSGDMKRGVPTIIPVWVAFESRDNSLATPKSRTFTPKPSGAAVRKMLAGLTSRCTSCRAWAAASPAPA